MAESPLVATSSADQSAAAPTDASIDQTLRQDAEGMARAVTLSGPRAIPPAKLPGYDIQRCLGEGAYGSVWLAIAQNTGKLVAIKFYSQRPGLDWSLLNREVEKLAVLYTCRDIIGLIDVGWDSDPPYYVMEYLENGSLASLLEHETLTPHEALRIATAVTQALVHAHRSGVLHCDIKPANVLLDSDFNPRLADFGQSRLSYEQNPALGTLFYMAPEQAELNAIPDARWDVYALGALFYHALSGGAPYRSPANVARLDAAGGLEERLAVYRQIIRESPRPQNHRHVHGVDRYLADIVDRCLEVDPERRYANAQAVMKALEKRVAFRTRRPLIALGIVGPVLLLLTMIPIAFRAMNNAVRTAEINLASRAIESDVVTAKILALAVERGLDRRRHDLLDIADDPELADLIEAAGGKPRQSQERSRLEKYLTQKKTEAEEDLMGARRPAADESWFLTDARGVQFWRAPPVETSLDQNYAWRDYFHGRGPDYSPTNVPAGIEPIREPHISRVFLSQSSGLFSVAISVPVWDPGHQKVVAVLARTIPLGQLLTGFKSVIHGDARADVDRMIALVDTRTWQLLDHPWMTPEHVKNLPEEVLHKLTLGERQRAQLAAVKELIDRNEIVGEEDRDVRYHDPAGALDPTYDTEWLAAFWPVGKTGWMAVVQERRDQALQPVREIRGGLIMYAVYGLSACCVLVIILWYFVLRAMGIRMPLRLKTVVAPS